MFLWQTLIIASIALIGMHSPALLVATTAVWLIWTLTAVFGTFPIWVGLIQMLSIGFGVVLGGLLSLLRPASSELSRLRRRTSQTIRDAKRIFGKQIFFEDWILQRNDLVRELRISIQNQPYGWLEKLSFYLEISTKGEKLTRLEKSLLEPKLQNYALRRLPHRTKDLRASESLRRLKKYPVRGFSKKRLTKSILWIIYIVIFCGCLTSWIFFLDDTYGAKDKQIVVFSTSVFWVLVVALSFPYRWASSWKWDEGPRRKYDEIFVPDSSLRDPFHYLIEDELLKRPAPPK
jgi:hypothetical protein